MDLWVVKASSLHGRKQFRCRTRLDAMLKVALLGDIRTSLATAERLEGIATRKGVTSVWAIKKVRVQKVRTRKTRAA